MLCIHSQPQSEMELYQRAQQLSGYTLGQLAHFAAIEIPTNLCRAKGWVGMLIERYLGAYAGNKPEQDFPHLGIELKTLPVTRKGKPLETTFVCVAPLTGNSGLTWQTSYVRYKLQRVLWVPVEGDRTIALAERRVGHPLLWSPNAQEEQALRDDWEELMDLIVLGDIDKITAKQGMVLQLRPKAAHSKIITSAIGAKGERIQTLPRGFYLKKPFTAAILARYFTLD